MRSFLITGTDTGVGKTRIACALASGWRARGMRIGVMKPAETGCVSDSGPQDALALKQAASSTDSLDLICPYRYAAALAPAMAAEVDGLPCPDADEIGRRFSKLSTDKDVVLVEGAGGLLVPISWELNYADLAQRLELELVIVVANRLGCLNITLLTLDYALRRGLNVRGTILNQVEPADSPAVRSNLHALTRLTAVPCLASIAFDGPLNEELFERLLL